MSSKTSRTADDFVTLNKNILTLKKAQDSFGKNVESLQETLHGYFEDLELRINNKKREREELVEDYDRKKKAARIEVDQDVRAYGYDAALRILTERKEVAIDAVELKELRQDLLHARQELKNSVESAVQDEKAKGARRLAIELKTKELENAAARAEIDAALKQKDSEIEVLARTIQDLKSDLEKQRNLTQAVAEASRPQAPVYAPSNSR